MNRSVAVKGAADTVVDFGSVIHLLGAAGVAQTTAATVSACRARNRLAPNLLPVSPMETAANWIAPIATTIAAIMVAANFGTRITGWGFVVFSVGSVAWIVIGAATDQPALLWQNVFLLVVNIVGIWRWLAVRARYEAGAGKATETSARIFRRQR